MRLFKQGLACSAAAAFAGSSAGASLPSRIWLGVERIAVACEITGPMAEDRKRALCATFAAEAARMTHYPVAVHFSDPAHPPREEE